MIITRTPLRITLGGGGTDLPSYYREHGGGFLVAAAIDKHIFVAVNRNFEPDILLKYSSVERVASPEEVQHPLLREILLHTGVKSSVEISSMADIPAGTGLGSSGAFTVGVLRALRAYTHESVSAAQLAEEACHIEIERLGEPLGKQDQYIAAVGGITALEFHPDDTVSARRLELANDVRYQLEENLLLFYTGLRRSASEVLSEEAESARAGGRSLDDNLSAVRQLGYDSLEALTGGDLGRFASLLTQQWSMKFERQPSATHREVDGWLQLGIDSGALGGKLIGAGGGGFLLFYAEEKKALRASMADLGFEEVRFGFDYEGSTTLLAGG